jgi:hypothetical protein
MRKPYLPRFIKLAVVLLVLLAPFTGTYSGVATQDPPETQGVESCSDPVIECKPPVRYLGDNKGCACFACEYGKKAQKILCSKDPAEKTKFRALLPRARR